MTDCIEKTIKSPRFGYHCTTKSKLDKYINSGRIIAPVRFWPTLEMAKKWQKHIGREFILKIELEDISYPITDHKAVLFCETDCKKFEVI